MATMLLAASSSSAVAFTRISNFTNHRRRNNSFTVCLAWRREREVDIDIAIEEDHPKPFVYRRASAAERWPNSDDAFQQRAMAEEDNDVNVRVRVSTDDNAQTSPIYRLMREDKARDKNSNDAFQQRAMAEEDDVNVRVRVSTDDAQTSPIYRLMREDKARDKAREREIFHQPQKGQTRRLKRMTKLALKRARDWKTRTERLANAICELELARPVADVLEDWPEQLNNEDLSVVLGDVGRENWRRALELYECLNLRKWYTPNPRMLATVLGILGRANQVDIARELFLRAEPELTGDHIQVFNGILGVYAKQGRWQAVQQILELMESKSCEPDIITFNTVINARCKGDLQPGMAMALLKEVRRASLKPDLITFNTLLGGCIASNNFTEAEEIVKEMMRRGYEPDAYSRYLLGKKKGLLHEGAKADS